MKKNGGDRSPRSPAFRMYGHTFLKVWRDWIIKLQVSEFITSQTFYGRKSSRFKILITWRLLWSVWSSSLPLALSSCQKSRWRTSLQEQNQARCQRRSRKLATWCVLLNNNKKHSQHDTFLNIITNVEIASSISLTHLSSCTSVPWSTFWSTWSTSRYFKDSAMSKFLMICKNVILVYF